MFRFFLLFFLFFFELDRTGDRVHQLRKPFALFCLQVFDYEVVNSERKDAQKMLRTERKTMPFARRRSRATLLNILT
jgi:hypothetical protein